MNVATSKSHACDNIIFASLSFSMSFCILFRNILEKKSAFYEFTG